MTLPDDLRATHAWQGTFVAAALNTVGMPGDFLLARRIPDMPWSPSAVSAGVGIVLMALLLIYRRRATVRFSSIAFLVNTIVMLWALWVTSGYWAAADQSWVPFQANKLGALAAAFLAPDLIVGLVSIVGFAATAIGKFYFLHPGIRDGFPVGEPWAILFYALFGGVLLAYRLRSVALEREALRLQAETAAADQLARTYMLLRDYANTPIQVIAFTLGLIQLRHPELKPDIGRLERAVERLMELSRALTRYESKHKWRPGDDSLDTSALFRHVPRSERRK